MGLGVSEELGERLSREEDGEESVERAIRKVKKKQVVNVIKTGL